MTLQAIGAVQTDPGRSRTLNEDWCGSVESDSTTPDLASVWAVADGVGGFGTGREAAQVAVNRVLSRDWTIPPRNVGQALTESIGVANRELLARTAAAANKQFASTFVAAAVLGTDLWVANVGDCRAYLIRGNAIRRLSREHTWVAEQIERGQLTPAEAANHPKRNVLTRCLGHRTAAVPDVAHESLRAEDRLVLCTDGLTRHVSDDEILTIAQSREPAQAVKRLIEMANERGGSDNVTVGVVELSHVTDARPDESRGRTAVQERPKIEAAPDRLELLVRLSQSLNSSLDVEETIRAAVENLAELTRAERGLIMLENPKTRRLEFSAGRNLDAATLARDKQISTHIVDRVFKGKQPLLIGDASVDADFKSFESVILHAPRSVMCAPLLVGDRAIGVAYVDNSLSAHLFTQSDMSVLSTFASMAAAAIENARLHDQLGAQLREMDAMRTMQDRIFRSVSSGLVAVDVHGTVTSANQAAAEILATSIDRLRDRPLSAALPARFMLALGPIFSGGDVGSTMIGTEMKGEFPGRGWVHFRHRVSPMRDDDGDIVGYVVVLDDVTELDLLERARQQANAERERIKGVFERYMAPQVYQELMRQPPDRAGIQGSRRELTIMFADIRGFTGWSEEARPEDVVGVLNEYLGTATDIIFEHEGTIDKFMGDAILALFGAPVELRDGPLQAVKAAIAMQKKFDTLGRDSRGWKPQFGIGINTGSGIVGSIGAPQLMSYTVIGDVVNVAARLQSEARRGEILLSGDTYACVGNSVEVESLGSTHLKGRREPVIMYKLVGLRE